MHPIFLYIKELQDKPIFTCLFFRQNADKNCTKKGEKVAPPTRKLYTIAGKTAIAKVVIQCENSKSPLSLHHLINDPSRIHIPRL